MSQSTITRILGKILLLIIGVLPVLSLFIIFHITSAFNARSKMYFYGCHSYRSRRYYFCYDDSLSILEPVIGNLCYHLSVFDLISHLKSNEQVIFWKTLCSVHAMGRRYYRLNFTGIWIWNRFKNLVLSVLPIQQCCNRSRTQFHLCHSSRQIFYIQRDVLLVPKILSK